MLTQELVDRYNSLVEEGVSHRAACSLLGIPESTYRTWRDRGKLEAYKDKRIAAGTLIRPHKKREKLQGNKFIFVAAQNNTFVHKDFLRTLEVCSEYNNAPIIVGTFIYNKNNFQNGANDSTWFDPAITPYIKDVSCEVFKGLIWCGELNILPTAVNPLSGLSSYCKSDSGIVPHAKLCLESIPTAKHKSCRMMYTTGCVTKANYIQQKAGQKAEFDHVYSALLAEVDEEGGWFVRQLCADSETGHFQDLTTLYTPEGVTENVRVEAINYGDIHSEKPDPVVYKATFGEGGLLDTLRPKYQFCNDTLDFTTRNHHRIKDIYHRYEMQVRAEGRDKVVDDIRAAVCALKDMQREWCQTVVVESNHDLALLRWLRESDPKQDNIWNAMFYHKCQLKVLEEIEKGNKRFSVFEWVCTDIDKDINAIFLKEDESFIICKEHGGGIECGSHGHLGCNGAKGSVKGFTKLGEKHNIGHGHAATILQGVFMAGIKGSLEQGYNKGASNWSHSDIITYSTGKRAIITFRKNKFRA